MLTLLGEYAVLMMDTLAAAAAPPGFEPVVELVGLDPPQAATANAQSVDPTRRRTGIPSLGIGF